MSLLQRVNNTQSNQQRSRFGQRNNNPGSSNSPFNRRQGNSPFGNRSNSSTPNNHLANVVIPAENTLVRFSMEGMGDPFYRLMGHEMNSNYANVYTLAEDLQKGGEKVDELVAVLDRVWEGYNLNGAMLVFNEDTDVLNALLKPTPMPTAPQNDNKDDESDSDDNDSDTPDWLANSNYGIERIRAIDLPLTLNVLTRARSQVIVARAPAVFGVEYLTRSLITDDPRLVALAKATGALPDNQ